MRLHSLRLQAFGPFVAEQVIDFEPLAAGGLFLLDGPTGAGKSTVLDAITFALYGPGDGGGWGRLHSHFAPPGVEPLVCLEFSVRGVRQRVTRSPEYRRPKRRGDGTTLEKAQVHLQRLEHGGWVSRSSRKDEVGEMLADDLGLSRDQFQQVVLLPQGEFMRFLQAGDDERRTLLTKLFGTGLYDRITDELDRRRLVATRELEASQRLLDVEIGAVGASAGLDSAGREALAELGTADRHAQLDALHAALDAAVVRAAGQAEVAEVQLREQRDDAARREVAAVQLTRLATAVAQRAAHEATREQFELAAGRLAAAERAEALRPLVRRIAAAETTVTAAERTWRALGGTADDGDLHALAADLARQSAELSHHVAREQLLADLGAEVTRAQAAVTAAERAARVAADRADQLPADLAAAGAAVRRALAQQAELPGLVARQAALTVTSSAAHDWAELEPRRLAALRLREQTFVEWERASARHRALAESRLANMAAELAGALVDGAPCAVCGGREHPAPAVAVPGAADADQVAAAEVQRAEAEQAYEQARETSAELDRRAAVLAAAVGTADVPDHHAVATLDAELATCSRAVADAHRAVAALVELEATVSRLELESAVADDAKQQSLLALGAAETARDAAVVAADLALAELTEAAAGYPSVAARRAALLAAAAESTDRADAFDVLGAAQREYASAVDTALDEAQSAGFADLGALRSALVEGTSLASLRTEVTSWQDDAVRLAALCADATVDGLDLADTEVAVVAAREAREAATAADARARQAGVLAARTAEVLEQFVTARARLDAARLEHDDLAEAAHPVVHLARLAKGVAGHRRVALTTYVLRQWFEQVVAAANIRLSGMSSGRYELVRVDEGATRAERVGLTVSVLDRHTGEQRSARSLSGGETFYTSLALALGLADVVRAEAGGVDLDTLFIDEGFGSLDADTLDQVMAVIDELRDRGRTVGIVSHVTELKDRIAERIEVRRLPDGSSTVRLIA